MASSERIRYLTTSELDDGWQLSCVDVGYALVAPGAPYPTSPGLHPPGYAEALGHGRVLSEYQLLFIAQGKGWLRVRSNRYEVEAGTAFLLFPGVPHSYAPDPETGWAEYWVGFRGPHADTLAKRGFLSSGDPVYPQGLPPSAVADFRQILDDVEAAVPGYRLVAASRILVLLAQLEATRRSLNVADGTAVLVSQARLSLEDHADSHDVDLAELARRLGLGYTHFSTLFHQYTGLSPHQYWLNLKINRAKGLLEAGRSVKETAFALGFESEFYFSRLFKKKTGSPPSRWNR